MLAYNNAEFVLLPLWQSWTKRQGRSSLRNTSLENRTSRRPAVPSGPSPAAGSSSTSLEASLKAVSQLQYDQWDPQTGQNSLQQRRKLEECLLVFISLWVFVSQAFRDSPLPWQGVSSPGEEATSWTAWTSGAMIGAGAWTWTWSSFTSTPSTGWSASSCSASSVTSSFLLFNSPATRKEGKKVNSASWDRENSFSGCLFTGCLSVGLNSQIQTNSNSENRWRVHISCTIQTSMILKQLLKYFK